MIRQINCVGNINEKKVATDRNIMVVVSHSEYRYLWFRTELLGKYKKLFLIFSKNLVLKKTMNNDALI